MLMGAGIASAGLTTGATGAFNRTRPLTHRFLFWARILSAIATVFASLATAGVVSFVLLLVFYGPVWLHLLDIAKSGSNGPCRGCRRQAYAPYPELLQSSASRLFLSLATTALLIFSAALLVFSPSSRFLNRRVPAYSSCVLTTLAVQAVRAIFTSRQRFGLLPAAFFLCTGLGPPTRPYAYVLVPILVSASLLFIAQLLIRRVELNPELVFTKDETMLFPTSSSPSPRTPHYGGCNFCSAVSWIELMATSSDDLSPRRLWWRRPVTCLLQIPRTPASSSLSH